MTSFAAVRAAVQKRIAYNRTKRALRNVPAELAVEDLGFYPGDAAEIAHKAIYG